MKHLYTIGLLTFAACLLVGGCDDGHLEGPSSHRATAKRTWQ